VSNTEQPTWQMLAALDRPAQALSRGIPTVADLLALLEDPLAALSLDPGLSNRVREAVRAAQATGVETVAPRLRFEQPIPLSAFEVAADEHDRYVAQLQRLALLAPQVRRKAA
jgi:hypothetical protein